MVSAVASSGKESSRKNTWSYTCISSVTLAAPYTNIWHMYISVITKHEGVKHPGEEWCIYPLLKTQYFHSNDWTVLMVYVNNDLIFSYFAQIQFHRFEDAQSWMWIRQLTMEQRPLVWPYQCSVENQLWSLWVQRSVKSLWSVYFQILQSEKGSKTGYFTKITGRWQL